MTTPRAPRRKPEHEYIVIEHVAAWSRWRVMATSKEEAIEKAQAGDVLDEGDSGSEGPSGRYEVERVR